MLTVPVPELLAPCLLPSGTARHLCSGGGSLWYQGRVAMDRRPHPDRLLTCEVAEERHGRRPTTISEPDRSEQRLWGAHRPLRDLLLLVVRTTELASHDGQRKCTILHMQCISCPTQIITQPELCALPANNIQVRPDIPREGPSKPTAASAQGVQCQEAVELLAHSSTPHGSQLRCSLAHSFTPAWLTFVLLHDSQFHSGMAHNSTPAWLTTPTRPGSQLRSNLAHNFTPAWLTAPLQPGSQLHSSLAHSSVPACCCRGVCRRARGYEKPRLLRITVYREITLTSRCP